MKWAGMIVAAIALMLLNNRDAVADFCVLGSPDCRYEDAVLGSYTLIGHPDARLRIDRHTISISTDTMSSTAAYAFEKAKGVEVDISVSTIGNAKITCAIILMGDRIIIPRCPPFNGTWRRP
jgi:hypothetical protein